MVIKVRFPLSKSPIFLRRLNHFQAYQYTDLLSCMLLDACVSSFFSYKALDGVPHFDFARWAIPVCLFFSWVYMRTKYHWTQLLGVFICICGLGLLVASDQLTHKDWHALSRGKGDGFMIAGATLYGFSELFPHSV